MATNYQDPTTYYRQQGLISDPGYFSSRLSNLPEDLPGVCAVIQGLMLHAHWAERYGVPTSRIRSEEAGLRHVSQMLARALKIDPKPIRDSRPPQRRLVGNCRNFSVLMTAFLRHLGIPARARCGFARYFKPGYHEDHWVCEYWSSIRQRWTLVDPQLDEFQINELKISFNPFNVPRDQFLVAGQAWQLCRHKHVDPETFGIFDRGGLAFVRCNLLRDIAALNKMPLLPWDVWSLMEKQEDELQKEDQELLDQVAIASMWDIDFPILRSLYAEDIRLRVPDIITSNQEGGTVKIAVATRKNNP